MQQLKLPGSTSCDIPLDVGGTAIAVFISVTITDLDELCVQAAAVTGTGSVTVTFFPEEFV